MSHERKIVACTVKIIRNEETPDKCLEFQGLVLLGSNETPLVFLNVFDGESFAPDEVWDYELHYHEGTVPFWSIES